MALTQKETSLLNDLKTQEQLCIEKYNKYACLACDPELKDLFLTICDTEKNHLSTVNQMLGKSSGKVQFSSFAGAECECECNLKGTEAKKYDAYLCQDILANEKHVSSLYDVSIFEFVSPDNRTKLNEIQKDEQHHGEQVYNYMSTHGMVGN